MLYKISTLNKIGFKGFQATRKCVPRSWREVARSAGRFKRLLGHHLRLTPKRYYRICRGGDIWLNDAKR